MKHVRVEYIFQIFPQCLVAHLSLIDVNICEAPFVGRFPFILKPCTLVVDFQ
jgi:hypothetical protein